MTFVQQVLEFEELFYKHEKLRTLPNKRILDNAERWLESCGVDIKQARSELIDKKIRRR